MTSIINSLGILCDRNYICYPSFEFWSFEGDLFVNEMNSKFFNEIFCCGIILLIVNFCSCTVLKRQTNCPPNTECQPLTSCPILNNVLNNECVISNRIENLSCGYFGSGQVCCPIDVPWRGGTRGRNDGVFTTTGSCGVSQVLGENYNGIGAYPWAVRVGFKNVLTGETKYPCSGSIINDRIILTAAHCALAKANNYKLFNIRAGEFSTDTEIDCGTEFCALPVQDLAISHVIVHPGYDKTKFKDNVALIVLRNKINYTVTAQPICLPEYSSYTISGDEFTIGWGKISNVQVISAVQQVVRQRVTNTQRCSNLYGATLPVGQDQLCVESVDNNKDVCSGFGGSPLLTRTGDRFYQIGILSFGSDSCGNDGRVPTVYADVRKYVEWIRRNIPVIYDD